MSTEIKYDEYLNEWTQVYLHGNIVMDKNPLDNLRDITLQFDNGIRQPNQIYAILRGMGIDQNRAACAVHEYVIKPRTIQKNTITMESNFDISILKDKLSKLKESLETFKQQDKSKINFSSGKALDIVNYQLSKFDTLSGIEKMIEEKNILLDTIKKQNESNPTSENEKIIFKLTGEVASLEKSLNETIVKNKFKMLRECSRELKTYDWLVPVSSFMNEINILMNNNKYSSKINETYHTLINHKYKDMYNLAINDLEKMLEHNEIAVKGEIIDTLNKHKWIPEISRIILEHAEEEKVMTSGRTGTINKVYSPVEMNENGSFIFTLNDKFYKLTSNKIEIANENEVSSKFINIKNALKQFKSNDNGILSVFRGNNVLEFNINENKLSINDQSIDHTNISNFRNYMKTINFYGLNELNKIDEICYLLESSDMIMELDFVTSIASKTLAGVFVNIINSTMTESIYINKINPAMGTNILVETKSGEEAQAHVSELIDIDISKIVYEELETENKLKVEVEKEKEEINNKISFLENKKNEVKEAISKYGNTIELDASLKVIDEELVKFDIKLQEVYSKKKVNEKKKSFEDLGYIMGTIAMNIDDYKKGDDIYVMADEYTSSGANDDIQVMDKETEDKKVLKKRYIKVVQ